MALVENNLSVFDLSKLPDASKMNIGIVVAEWNGEITDALLKGAETTLISCGVFEKNIYKIHVPGTFELTAGAKFISSRFKLDVVICLGCVVKGETPHFNFICQAVAQGLTNLTIISSIPYIFGVLTTLNLDQARERAGGKHGNKGIEAAVTAIKMAALKVNINAEKRIGFS